MDFRILGPLEVNAGDGPVALGGAKPRALLAVLLLNANGVVSSDGLIDALWGERPPDTAAKALQVHVSQLRKALGADRIATRAPGYTLRVERDELDLARFERLHAEASAASDPERARALLEEALGLWRGTPLADFTYEPFAQAEVARLEDARLAAIEQRIDADLELGRHAAVIGELEALIAEHPHRERPRAQQMLALYRAGRQAEALEAYQSALATLTGELGIDPSRELRDLQAAILRQDAALDAPAAPAPRSAAPQPAGADGGFVGRERELAELDAALGEALAGAGRVVLVAGEPGIGKSRLAEELGARARAAGARVLVGRCWEAGGAPAYWPWVQALRAYVRERDADALRAELGRDGPEVARMLPELHDLVPDLPAVAPDDSDGARFRLLAAIASFMASAAAASPLVVVLDDLHAADASSLLLLRFAAAQLDAAPVLIVGCYRDTEIGTDLAEALAELAHQPAVRRVSLKGLGERDTERLLERALGEGPSGQLAAEIQSGTQGNPLFTTEIARLLVSEGAPQGGRLPIPEGVRETIRRRVGRQSEGCREVLALASVVGREFDPEAVSRAGAIAHEDLLAALDEALGARLVEALPEIAGRMRFSHILVRDALYEDIPASRRPRLHRAVAEALEFVYAASVEPHLAELAQHYLEAGADVAGKAAEYSRRAGDHAAAQHAYDEAARHYSTALRVGEARGEWDASATRGLLLALGDVLSRGGRDDQAKPALKRAADMAERDGDPAALGRAALLYCGRFAWARGSSDPLLVPLLERALAAVGDGDSATRVRLLSRLAAATRDEPTRDRRVAIADEALAMAERLGDPETLAYGLEGRWTAIEGPEMPPEGIEVGARLIALGQQLGDTERVFSGHDHRVHLYWQLADRSAVEVELAELTRLAGELRQPAQLWHVGTCNTMLAMMEGRLDEAEAILEETRALGERSQSWNAGVTYRLGMFVLRREQGRLAEIEDTIRRAMHEYPTLLRFRCALVHLLAELGDEDDARRVLDGVLVHDLAHEYRDAEWLFSLTLLAAPCAGLGDAGAAARLHELLAPYERMYAQAPVEAVFGCVASALGTLARACGRYDDAEQHFHTALQVEDRMGARPWVAHAQAGLAQALLERDGPGDADRARELVAQARATYRELGMAPWEERAAALV